MRLDVEPVRPYRGAVHRRRERLVAPLRNRGPRIRSIRAAVSFVPGFSMVRGVTWTPDGTRLVASRTSATACREPRRLLPQHRHRRAAEFAATPVFVDDQRLILRPDGIADALSLRTERSGACRARSSRCALPTSSTRVSDGISSASARVRSRWSTPSRRPPPLARKVPAVLRRDRVRSRWRASGSRRSTTRPSIASSISKSGSPRFERRGASSPGNSLERSWS